MNTLHFLHTMGTLFLLGVQKLIQLMHFNRLRVVFNCLIRKGGIMKSMSESQKLMLKSNENDCKVKSK